MLKDSTCLCQKAPQKKSTTRYNRFSLQLFQRPRKPLEKRFRNNQPSNPIIGLSSQNIFSSKAFSKPWPRKIHKRYWTHIIQSSSLDCENIASNQCLNSRTCTTDTMACALRSRYGNHEMYYGSWYVQTPRQEQLAQVRQVNRKYHFLCCKQQPQKDISFPPRKMIFNLQLTLFVKSTMHARTKLNSFVHL